MAYELKTKETDHSVVEFIKAVESPKSGRTPTGFWTFLQKQRDLTLRCGVRASSGSARTIISILQDMKETRRLLAFHRAKRKSAFILQQVILNGKNS